MTIFFCGTKQPCLVFKSLLVSIMSHPPTRQRLIKKYLLSLERQNLAMRHGPELNPT